jgi:heme-degrading monooxygenase HmoA
VATLINVFTVRPERQHELVESLARVTDEVMRRQPGFISANTHASTDGNRVVNYAQWATPDDFRAMLADPEAREQMATVSQLVEGSDPLLYVVESVHHA